MDSDAPPTPATPDGSDARCGRLIGRMCEAFTQSLPLAAAALQSRAAQASLARDPLEAMAAQLLQTNAEPLGAAFCEHMQTLAERARARLSLPSGGGLDTLENHQLERCLLSDQMADALRGVAQDILPDLLRRVSVLLGRPKLPPEQNPLAAESISAAVTESIQRLMIGMSVKETIQREIQSAFPELARQAYGDIHRALVQLETVHQQAGNPALAQAQAAVEAALQGQYVYPEVAEFARVVWAAYLSSAPFEREPRVWEARLATLDELLWSLQPKLTQTSRQQLMNALPDLVKQLDAGMRAVGVSEESREAFFSQLVKLHSLTVRVSFSQDEPIPLPENAEEIELTDVYGQPPVQSERPASAHDLVAETLAPITRGVWLEFELDDGDILHAKLAWISPQQGMYVFTNREGRRAVAIKAESLARRLREGKVRAFDGKTAA